MRYLVATWAILALSILAIGYALEGNDDPPLAPSGDVYRTMPGPPVGMVVDATPAPVASSAVLAPTDPASAPAGESGSDTTAAAQAESSPLREVSEGDSAEPQAVICAYPWDCATSLRVADCEGYPDPSAVGGDDERGWFQIHPIHFGKPQCNPANLFDPAYNTACAYSLYSDSGTWQHWYSSIGCWGY